MNQDLLIKSIKEIQDFDDLREVLITSIVELKKHGDYSELEFKSILGQLANIGSSKSKEKDLSQMELIYRFQYRQTGSFETGLIDLLYKSSDDNKGLLAISYPFEVEAFNKYGRENINLLKIKIDELKEEINNNINTFNRSFYEK